MTEPTPADLTAWSRWRAVANLYHAVFTGLILTVVTQRGAAAAEEFVFRVFRRQQQERFLAGLGKLGLTGLPPAVAAAQYHYLSNWIGGVSVEYMYESDRKAWIRYPPPRWIWQGAAICGIPTNVSRAMLRGWHANNGVALGNLKLGFVCTKQTVDVQDGLEGYYYEYDRDLAIDERLVFAPHLQAPRFEPALAPVLPIATWPRHRLEKVYRNYAMEYVRTSAPVMLHAFGPHEGAHLLHRTAKLIGMQFFRETLPAFAMADGIGAADTPDRFAVFLAALLRAGGDGLSDDVASNNVQDGVLELRQPGWALMADVADHHPACAQVLVGLIEGLAAAAGRGFAVSAAADDAAKSGFVWRIARR